MRIGRTGTIQENSLISHQPQATGGDTASSVEESRQFDIDLRVEGVSQDAILKDEEHVKQINKTLEKLKSGSCTNQSIRDDLEKNQIIRHSAKNHVA